MKTYLVWPVIFARLVAVAGCFVAGGSALGLLPESWQKPVALVSTLIIAVSASLPSVHQPANAAVEPPNAAAEPASELPPDRP